MAHIEVDTDDLTLFSNDIKEMSKKIDNLDALLSSKFQKEINLPNAERI